MLLLSKPTFLKRRKNKKSSRDIILSFSGIFASICKIASSKQLHESDIKMISQRNSPTNAQMAKNEEYLKQEVAHFNVTKLS